MPRIRTHRFLLTLLTTLVATMASPAFSQQSNITLKVANYGGVFTATLKKYAGDLFTERTGVKVEYINADPVDHLAKLIASKGRAAPFDVVYLDDNVQAEAIKAGVLQKLDPAAVPNLAHIYDKAKNPDGYGPGMIFFSVGIAYNYEKFKAAGIPAPTSWNDLWNPKLAGHVAVSTLSLPPGRDFLIAAATLNGGNENSLEKGIDKIATLKAQSYPDSSSVLEALFKSGDAWAAPWTNGRAWGMIDHGFPLKFILPKEGGFGEMTTIDVVKGTKYPKEAEEYINYVLAPLSQLGMAEEVPYGPTNKTLASVLVAYPELAKKFPASPEDIAKLRAVDWSVFNRNYPKAVDLWNRKVISK